MNQDQPLEPYIYNPHSGVKQPAYDNGAAAAADSTFRSDLGVDLPDSVKPGEYHPQYIPAMLKFFDKPKNRIVKDTYTWRSGAVEEKVKEVPNSPPMFSQFARLIGVPTRKLQAWAKKYPEFRDAYETCQEIFEEFLIEHGLSGGYGAIAMKFVAVNKTKMRDKVINENVTVDLNKILNDIQAGKIGPGGTALLGEGEDENTDDN